MTFLEGRTDNTLTVDEEREKERGRERGERKTDGTRVRGERVGCEESCEWGQEARKHVDRQPGSINGSVEGQTINPI